MNRVRLRQAIVKWGGVILVAMIVWLLAWNVQLSQRVANRTAALNAATDQLQKSTGTIADLTDRVEALNTKLEEADRDREALSTQVAVLAEEVRRRGGDPTVVMTGPRGRTGEQGPPGPPGPPGDRTRSSAAPPTSSSTTTTTRLIPCLLPTCAMGALARADPTRKEAKMDGAMIEIDVATLALVSGAVIPLLVGALAKLRASSTVKSVLNLALSFLTGAVGYLALHDGSGRWQEVVTAGMATWIVSGVSYQNLWRPNGVAAAVQARTADFGIGRPTSEMPRAA